MSTCNSRNVAGRLCQRDHEHPGEPHVHGDYVWVNEPPVDPVNHPAHYKAANGLESIDVIEAFAFGFNLGNCFKYIARAGKKNPATHLEDLEKAAWYLAREIERRRAAR